MSALLAADARACLPTVRVKYGRVDVPRRKKYRLQSGYMPAPASVLEPQVTWGTGPEAVYLIECWSPGAYYVGVSREVERRLRRHWDDTWIDTRRAVVLPPSVLFMTTYGYKATLAIVRVADRATAEKLECEWTYELVESARVVFGRGITANCPGTRWLNGFGGVPWWDRNTVRNKLGVVPASVAELST